MKIEWSKWNVGGKIIFIAGSMAVISMFMNWVDFGITARIGISQGAFLILVFWIYPIYMLLNNRIIELRWGLPSAILSILAVIIYIASKSKSLAGYSDNFSAIGAWLFLIASIALTIGVAKYLPIDANTGEEEERKLALEKLAKMLLLVVLFAVGLSMLGYWLFTPSNKVSAIHLISGLICIGLVIWIGKSLKEPSSRKEIVTEKTKSLKVQGSYVSNFVIKILLSCAIFSLIASVASPLSIPHSDFSFIETVVINLITNSVIFLSIGLIPLLFVLILAKRQATVEGKIKRLNWGIIITWIISLFILLILNDAK